MLSRMTAATLVLWPPVTTEKYDNNGKDGYFRFDDDNNMGYHVRICVLWSTYWQGTNGSTGCYIKIYDFHFYLLIKDFVRPLGSHKGRCNYAPVPSMALLGLKFNHVSKMLHRRFSRTSPYLVRPKSNGVCLAMTISRYVVMFYNSKPKACGPINIWSISVKYDTPEGSLEEWDGAFVVRAKSYSSSTFLSGAMWNGS